MLQTQIVSKKKKIKRQSKYLNKYSNTFSTKIKDKIRKTGKQRRVKNRRKKLYPIYGKPIAFQPYKKVIKKHILPRYGRRFYVRYKKIRGKIRALKMGRAYASFGWRSGIVIVTKSRTNYFFTVVDAFKRPLFKISTGRLSNHSRRKAMAPYTFELIAPYILKCFEIYKFKAINIIWKIYSPRHMHTFMRQIRINKMRVLQLAFRKPIPHNGVRPQKKARK